jgi:hypothetical protein
MENYFEFEINEVYGGAKLVSRGKIRKKLGHLTRKSTQEKVYSKPFVCEKGQVTCSACG